MRGPMPCRVRALDIIFDDSRGTVGGASLDSDGVTELAGVAGMLLSLPFTDMSSTRGTPRRIQKARGPCCCFLTIGRLQAADDTRIQAGLDSR